MLGLLLGGKRQLEALLSCYLLMRRDAAPMVDMMSEATMPNTPANTDE